MRGRPDQHDGEPDQRDRQVEQRVTTSERRAEIVGELADERVPEGVDKDADGERKARELRR